MEFSPVLLRSAILLLLLQTRTSFASASALPGDEIAALRRPQHKIFHPMSASCVSKQGYGEPPALAPCERSDSWNYTPQKFFTAVGTYYCLKAAGPSLPAELSIACDVSDSQWSVVSGTDTTHISTELGDGTTVCLDVGDDNTIVTNPCRTLSKGEKGAGGDSQCFQFITVSSGKD